MFIIVLIIAALLGSTMSMAAEAVTVTIESIVCMDTQDSDGADHIYLIADGHGKKSPHRIDQGGVWQPHLIIKNPTGPVHITLFDKESIGSDDLLGTGDIPLDINNNGLIQMKGRKSYWFGDYRWHYEIHYRVQ